MVLQAFPGMVPYKRAAGDKSGVPVYQPSATAYQQLLQPFVPVSCEYRAPPPPPAAPGLAAFTGMPLNKQTNTLQNTMPNNLPPTTNYQLLSHHFAALAAMRPPVPPASVYPSTSTTPHTHTLTHTHSHSQPNPSLITDLLAAAVNNNNDDELQPYKKMKTT